MYNLSDAIIEAGGQVTVVDAKVKLFEPSTAVILISPNTDAVAQALYEQGCRLRELATARNITGTLEAKDAADDLAVIQKLKKSLEAKGKEYTDPINAHLKAVREGLKSLMQPFDEADTINRQKYAAWDKEEKRKQAEVEEINRLRLEAARREAVMNNGEITESAAPIPLPFVAKNVHGDFGTAGMMDCWKYRVTDFALLPDSYKMENSALLTKVVKSGLRTIPGVEIYNEPTMKVTSK